MTKIICPLENFDATDVGALPVVDFAEASAPQVGPDREVVKDVTDKACDVSQCMSFQNCWSSMIEQPS